MIEDKITKVLKKQDMTIEEISQAADISRATASKYLLFLEARGIVKFRPIGKAKLFSLKAIKN